MQFRGASAEAVASLLDELAEVATGAPGRAATMASDLFTVASTLRGEVALRRFATDASLPAEARTGLVRELFGDKVDDASLTLLVSAVGRRWTGPRDLPDALEEVAVTAQVLSAGNDAGRLSDELFAFAQAVKDNPPLRDALSDPTRSIDAKGQLLRSLLDGKALPATIALAEQALSGAHRTVGVALEEYEKLAARAHGRSVATVRVAHEVTAAEQSRLAELLSRQYGRPVHLNLLVDPAVLGGIRIEIGDDVIDGTVLGRLDDARRRIAG